MKSYQPDWWRFSKALCVEAERGFTNLQGSQYQFHEFFYVSLKELFENAPPETQQRCQDLAEEFLRYPELAIEDRQHLIADTRRFLLQLQRLFECRNKVSDIREKEHNRNPQARSAGMAEKAKNVEISLEQSLEKIIGPRNSDRVAKLGILTVFDLLYYYPRDHIDYARQVKIKELEPGETVTLIAQVKRCSCFSSPRNKKLTILELVLSDNTGQLKISRFYAGNRYSSKGWQHQQKNNYAPGALIAASGLVKKNQYGITLDNPELEVLDDAGGQIESMKIGRLLPVYPLADGIGADVVRKAVIAVLPAAKQLKDALPPGLLNQYQLIGLTPAIEAMTGAFGSASRHPCSTNRGER